MTWYVVNKLITDNYQEALKWANEAANETQKDEQQRIEEILHRDSQQNTSQKRATAANAGRH